ncbi:MAG: cytochrome c peroxidase, partial [Gemmatimonadaceae bacterium]
GNESAAATAVQRAYLAGLDSLAAAAEELTRRLDSDTGVPGWGSGARRAFVRARTAYKRVEYLAEHYNPTVADLLNGPAIPEVDDDDPSRVVMPPEGFQVLEEHLFPGAAKGVGEVEALRSEAMVLLANARRLRAFAERTPLTEENILDAVRLHLARVLALGLSGFDSPIAQRSLPEAAVSLAAMRDAMQPFAPRIRAASPETVIALEARFDAAIATLEGAGSFDTFDRLAFLTDHAAPLFESLHVARLAMGIELPPGPRAWRADAASIFDPGAFDPSFFSAAPGRRHDPEEIELGRLLFFDPILSGNEQRACVSCHRPERAFTDGEARSVAFSAVGRTLRNAPTLINAGLQGGSFHDLRTAYLEDQVTEVIQSASEMHGSLDVVAVRLAESPDYVERFRRAFGDTAVSRLAPSVRSALAAYVRSLTRLDSRFDRFLRGDHQALGEDEARGFNLFMGKAKCGTCHFFPLFNGTVPPAYAKTELEVLGVPGRSVTRRAKVDRDEGRYRVLGNPLHRHAFKTPSVRNVELTAPYMHNGVYRTLEEVVDFYDRGGGAGIGAELDNQTLPPDELKLTEWEQQDLVAFMKSLTDTAGTGARPSALPSFPRSPHRNRRPLGGAY